MKRKIALGLEIVAVCTIVSLSMKAAHSTCYDVCMGTKCWFHSTSGHQVPKNGVPVYLNLQHSVNSSLIGGGSQNSVSVSTTGSHPCAPGTGMLSMGTGCGNQGQTEFDVLGWTTCSATGH
jgi:hypothetical protein